MQSIHLRPATIEDAELLLAWKNDPVTRQFSIVTHEVIPLETHYLYLLDHLKDIQIIEYGGVPCGDIRIDEEVSIRLDPEYRGKKIGYKALKLVVKPGMVAKIVEGNIASMRLFIKLGFRPTAYMGSHYLYTL